MAQAAATSKWECVRKGTEGNGRTILGEGPLWSEVDQCLYWIDIEGKVLHRHTPASSASESAAARNDAVQFDSMVGCIALTNTPGLILLAAQSGLFLFDWTTFRSYFLLAFPSDSALYRFNDGIVDPLGNWIIGTLFLDEDVGKDKGSLYCYKWDDSKQELQQTTLLENQMHISNGLGFSSDNKQLYYIDTPLQRVDVFDVDASSSSASSIIKLSNRRIAFPVPEEHAHPDGMCMDAQDRVLVAHWAGSRVTVWSKQNKNPSNDAAAAANTTCACEHVIPFPTAKTTSCIFGGKELRDLYVTTASRGSDLSTDPFAGSLFVIRNSPYQGKQSNRFNGKFELQNRKFSQHKLVE